MLWAVRAALFAGFLCLGAQANADAVSQGQEIAGRGIAASDAGNHAAAADLFRQALALRPNHPGLTMRLAAASARAGRKDDTLQALEAYAAMGLRADIATDPDFAKLAADPRFAALRARFAENAKPRGSAAVIAAHAEPEFLAEGLAHDPATGRLFVSSVHKRKIVAVDGGAASDFVKSAQDGLFGAFGMALDKARGSLWVASAAMPYASNIASPDKNRAGLFEFALADAHLKRKALTAPDGTERVIGDLVVTPAGDVFASDSTAPVIYRLAVGASALEEFVRSDEFHSLQGLALSADGTKLAVADYSSGIHIVDLASRTHAVLAMPPDTTLHGTDGLVRHGRDLIGIQNGIDPQRVILLRMNQAWSAIESTEIIAANLPEADEPTLGTLDGEDLLVIGNGQWSRFADDGSIKPGAAFAPTRIVRIKLPPARR